MPAATLVPEGIDAASLFPSRRPSIAPRMSRQSATGGPSRRAFLSAAALTAAGASAPEALDAQLPSGPSGDQVRIPGAGYVSRPLADKLGESVSIYLDGGPCGEAVPSTIVDVTGSVARVLRVGDVSVEALREVVGDLEVP